MVQEVLAVPFVLAAQLLDCLCLPSHQVVLCLLDFQVIQDFQGSRFCLFFQALHEGLEVQVGQVDLMVLDCCYGNRWGSVVL